MKNMTTLRNTLAALHPDMTTVSCYFRGKNSDKNAYTFKVTKKLAETLSEGDLVVVEAKYGHSIVEVSEVHETSEVDLEAGYLYQWVYQKLDTTENDRLNAAEIEFAEQLDRVQKDKARKVLAENMGIDLTSLDEVKLVE